MLGTFVHVFKNDGFIGLYSGVSTRHALSSRSNNYILTVSLQPDLRIHPTANDLFDNAVRSVRVL